MVLSEVWVCEDEGVRMSQNLVIESREELLYYIRCVKWWARALRSKQK